MTGASASGIGAASATGIGAAATMGLALLGQVLGPGRFQDEVDGGVG